MMSHTAKLLNPRELTILGTGISPRPDSMVPGEELDPLLAACRDDRNSSPSTSFSDESTSLMSGDASNVIQNVVSMNKALEDQIDALRLRLNVEDKHHTTEKDKIKEEKKQAIYLKDEELSEMRDSMANRDERISVLVRCGNEKDRLIQNKVNELNDLKGLVQQTEDYANNLRKQVVKLRQEKKHLMSDALYKEQNAEIHNLKQQIKVLKHTIVTMEDELKRAKKVIDQQDLKLSEIEGFQKNMQKKFKEELDKATKAMRQEVERMREVMNQNYEEMKSMREQNKEMCSDVKDIKDMLLNGGQPEPSSVGSIHLGLQYRPSSQMNVHQLLVSNTERAPSSAKPNINPARRSMDQLSAQYPTRPRQTSPVAAYRSTNRSTLTRNGFRGSAGVNSKSAGAKLLPNSQSNLPPLSSDGKEKTQWIPTGKITRSK